MKKVLLAIMLIILMTNFIACSRKGDNMGALGDDYVKVADRTFSEIISAVKSNDAAKIADLFAPSVKSETKLSTAATSLIDFVRGDIVSFSSASEAGVGTDTNKDSKKIKKEINAAFSVHTTESTYYIAVKECTKDDFSCDVGLLSIYIIEANNWTEDYIYRGDGKWTPGIHIIDFSQ
ncbi:MAG: DUF5104 domain-containing protein [Oscillospiraceae bacterium]|nr:DUF5104 domain-containing protein [Oscillospiraceae bacterium]